MAKTNKTYDVVIKTSSVDKQKANVLSLLDEQKAAFKTIIGEELVRGKYPVYVDDAIKERQYGSIEKVMDGDTQMSNEQIKELVTNGANIKLTGYTGSLIQGIMTLDEV